MSFNLEIVRLNIQCHERWDSFGPSHVVSKYVGAFPQNWMV